MSLTFRLASSARRRAGGVEGHQDRAVNWGQGGFDQAAHFVLAQDEGQVDSLFRVNI